MGREPTNKEKITDSINSIPRTIILSIPKAIGLVCLGLSLVTQTTLAALTRSEEQTASSNTAMLAIALTAGLGIITVIAFRCFGSPTTTPSQPNPDGTNTTLSNDTQSESSRSTREPQINAPSAASVSSPVSLGSYVDSIFFGRLAGRPIQVDFEDNTTLAEIRDDLAHQMAVDASTVQIRLGEENLLDGDPTRPFKDFQPGKQEAFFVFTRPARATMPGSSPLPEAHQTGSSSSSPAFTPLQLSSSSSTAPQEHNAAEKLSARYTPNATPIFENVWLGNTHAGREAGSERSQNISLIAQAYVSTFSPASGTDGLPH